MGAGMKCVIVLSVAVWITVIVLSWRAGWNSHAEHVNAMAAKKREEAEKSIQQVEKKAANATETGKVIYKTITRDVVKYVQTPNRTVCQFDSHAVQLRQRAIDAANTIPGFDESSLQGQ